MKDKININRAVYLIDGFNVIILENATKSQNLKNGYVVIQDLKTGLTAITEKARLKYKCPINNYFLLTERGKD
jgi:hypothetical protein